jgi:3D (Asp-Asp-Asp) domain-containing protein
MIGSTKQHVEDIMKVRLSHRLSRGAQKRSGSRRSVAFLSVLLAAVLLLALPQAAAIGNSTDSNTVVGVLNRQTAAVSGMKATVYADGISYSKTVPGGTVGSLLESMSITLGEKDEVEPALETKLFDGIYISVTRVTVKLELETETIPYAIEKVGDSANASAVQVVIQEGTEGLKYVEYDVVYRNGIESSRSANWESIAIKPTAQVIEYVKPGSKATMGNVIVTKGGEILRFTKALEVEATAYTTEGYKSKHTFSGTVARVGAIAVDPRVIPLGTRMYIEAPNGSWIYGTAVAEDTGGAIKGYIIDLFFNTRSECFNFGRQQAMVYILESE